MRVPALKAFRFASPVPGGVFSKIPFSKVSSLTGIMFVA